MTDQTSLHALHAQIMSFHVHACRLAHEHVVMEGGAQRRSNGAAL